MTPRDTLPPANRQLFLSGDAAAHTFGLSPQHIAALITFSSRLPLGGQQVVDALRDWLGCQPWFAQHFPSGAPNSLRSMQYTHWAHLLALDLGPSYRENRQALRALFARAGLPLEADMACMAFAQRWLLDQVRVHDPDDERLAAAQGSSFVTRSRGVDPAG